KTGTITLGRPQVAEIVPLNGVAEDELLSLAASAEQFSEHPVAKAIVAHAKEKRVALRDTENFNNEPGMGVTATIGGKAILVGSDKLLSRSTGVSHVPNGAPWHGRDARATGGTHVLIGRESQTIGSILLTDTIKPDSREAIAQLHAAGLKVVLLT